MGGMQSVRMEHVDDAHRHHFVLLHTFWFAVIHANGEMKVKFELRKNGSDEINNEIFVFVDGLQGFIQDRFELFSTCVIFCHGTPSNRKLQATVVIGVPSIGKSIFSIYKCTCLS